MLQFVADTRRNPLCRRFFRFMLQASRSVLAIFLTAMLPVQPVEVVVASQSCLVAVPPEAPQDLKCRGHKCCPFLQALRPHTWCFSRPGGAQVPWCTPGLQCWRVQQHALHTRMALLVLALHPETTRPPLPSLKGAGQHSPGYRSCWQLCYLLMKDCSAQSHFHLILVEGRKGYVPLLLVCFSPSDFSFVMLQGQAVGSNLENHYHHAPVFTGTWTIYLKRFMKGLAPICLGENHRTVQSLLISFLFIQEDERRNDAGHLEGWREGELLCACPADSLPAQVLLSCRWTAKFAAQPEEPTGSSSAPCSCCHLQKPGAVWTNVVFRKARLIASFHSWHTGHCVSRPAASTPSPDGLQVSETTQMSCKLTSAWILSWT